jgi:sugar phosphate isomerase/epimerase
MTWHIGAFSANCHRRPVAEVIRTLADAGFLGIEIPAPAGWRRAEIEAIRDALRTTGMRAVAIHASCGRPLDLADPDARGRNDAIDAVLNAAAVLEALHGRVVVVQPTDSHRAAPDLAARVEHACESVRIVQQQCAGRGMTLAIETPPPQFIGGAPDEFAHLLTAAGSDARVCLDIDHIALEDWDAFADLAAGRLAHVHAPDIDDSRADPCASVNGRIDWPRVGRTLDRMNYDAWLMLELGDCSEPLAQSFHRRAQYLRDRLDGIRSKARLAGAAY